MATLLSAGELNPPAPVLLPPGNLSGRPASSLHPDSGSFQGTPQVFPESQGLRSRVRVKKLNREGGSHCGHVLVLRAARRSSRSLEHTLVSEEGETRGTETRGSPTVQDGNQVRVRTEVPVRPRSIRPHAQRWAGAQGRCPRHAVGSRCPRAGPGAPRGPACPGKSSPPTSRRQVPPKAAWASALPEQPRGMGHSGAPGRASLSAFWSKEQRTWPREGETGASRGRAQRHKRGRAGPSFLLPQAWHMLVPGGPRDGCRGARGSTVRVGAGVALGAREALPPVGGASRQGGGTGN